MRKLTYTLKRNAWLIITGFCAFALAAIGSTPASLLPAVANLNGRGLSYSGIEGTIWSGAVKNAVVSHTALGDISYRVSAISLLRLAPTLYFKSEAAALSGEGRLSEGVGGLHVGKTRLDIDLGAFARKGILGEPVKGVVRLNINRLTIDRNGCRRAEGTIWTDVLNDPVKRFQGEAMPMSGNVTCDGADLLIALSGESKDGSAALDIRIKPDLSYELEAKAQPAQADVATALVFFGFEEQNGALTYGSAGTLKGVGS